MSRHVLPYLAVARVSGPDAAAFLHAQLSAALAGLEKDDATFACYCSPRGQVYGLLLACRRSEDFLMIGAARLMPSLLQRLRMFVLRAQVELTADDSLAVLGDECGLEPGVTAPGNCWVPAGGPAYCVMPRGSLPRNPGSASAWKAAELERGIAWLDEHTSERFIPQMLGFDRLGAVSFSKGCYPGQEIIARARYLGKVKRGPMQVVLEAEAEGAQTLAASMQAGSTVTLDVGGDRQDAALVDQALLADGRLLLFLVAPLLETEPAAIEIDGRSYRCATM